MQRRACISQHQKRCMCIWRYCAGRPVLAQMCQFILVLRLFLFFDIFSRDDDIFKEVDFGMEVDFGAEENFGDLDNLLGESSSLFQIDPAGSNGDIGFSGGKFDEDSLLPRSHKVKVELELDRLRLIGRAR